MLSYGEFSTNKKLFLYENDGVPILPIFYDPELTVKFSRAMRQVLRNVGDNRHLNPQVCAKPKAARDMFQFISAISPELHTIAIDPSVIGDMIVESDTITFEEAIDQLQELCRSSNTSSDSI